MMESFAPASERHPHGQVQTDVIDDHILVMTIDRVEKKNAFTPKISNELEDAMTRLDDDPELFVGVLLFAGDHTTAGLEMPLFFSEESKQESARRVRQRTSEPVDPYGLGRRLRKPRITAVQGITYTIGIPLGPRAHHRQCPARP
jgi:enoyl-CoA hydratase